MIVLETTDKFISKKQMIDFKYPSFFHALSTWHSDINLEYVQIL